MIIIEDESEYFKVILYTFGGNKLQWASNTCDEKEDKRTRMNNEGLCEAKKEGSFLAITCA